MSANLMSLARSGGKFLKLFGDRKMVKQLPYYCEVEYLESTGTQYIDTGVYVNSNDTVETECVITITGSTGSRMLMGFSGKSIGYWGVNSRKYENGGLTTSRSVGVKDKVLFIWKYNASDKKIRSMLYVNDTNYSSRISTTIEDGTFTMFSLGKNYKMIAKIYSFNLTINGFLVRDFIPVLDRDMRPAMYDRVTGKLFYNKGTGEFLTGPDKTI